MCGQADDPEENHNPPRPRPRTLAVIDETVPFVGGGVCYAVVSGILLADENDARAAMRDVIPPGRRRPFHWHQEGVNAKTSMVAALNEVGVLGRAVVVSCGRQSQEAARAIALATTVRYLAEAIGGAVHEHLTCRDHDGWYEQIRKATGLSLEYRSLETG